MMARRLFFAAISGVTAGVSLCSSVIVSLLPSGMRHCLCYFGRCCECMEGRWGWQCPFEAVGAFPYLIRCLFAAAHTLDNEVNKYQLAQAEDKTADACNHVPFRELDAVIRDAARHPGQSQKVHGEEQDVDGNSGQPEM